MAEARKRRRGDEEESEDLGREGDAVNFRHPKRARTEDAEDQHDGAPSGGVEVDSLAMRDRKNGQTSSSYGSEEGEISDGQGASAGDKVEEGEIRSSSPADGHVHSPSAEDSSDGEHVSEAASNPPSPSSPGHRAQGHGWNRGINAGQVRTSLSLSAMSQPAKLSATPAPAPTPAAPQPPRKERTSKPPSPQEPSSTTSHFQKSGVSLGLPPPGDRNEGESWQVRFQEWTRSLLKLNPGQVSTITPELILDAYSHFVDRVCDIHNRKRRNAKTGAELCLQKGSLSDILNSARDSASNSEAKQAMDSKNEAGKQAPGQSTQPSNESLPNMPTATDWEIALEGNSTSQNDTRTENGEENNGDSHNGERPSQEQSKQNGSSSMPPPPQPPKSIPSGDEELKLQQKYFPRANVPSEMCILCLQHGHNASTCPANLCKDCGVWYQHSSFACPSKRRCGKCKSLGHVAKDCRSDIILGQGNAAACAHCGGDDHQEKDCDVLWRTYHPESPTKCHSIYAFCASCGEEGHFYFDCEVGRDRFPKPRTWCEENLARYLDKTSKRAPISEAKARPELRRPELVGRSNENIYFESDDSDGETPFIGNPVQPKKSVGRINVSSNIHFGGQSRLPPSTTLPPRPQSYSDTIRSEAQQQDGGRRQHGLPPRPPASRHNGSDNYQAVPPPPGLQRGQGQGQGQGQGRGGGGWRDNSNGNSSRGGRNKNSRGGRGGGRGNGRGGNRGSNRGGKW